MKYLLLFCLGFGLPLLLTAQTTDSIYFELPFYFEDAIGNRDTITVVAAIGANQEFNPELGEINLAGQPYDSVFEARAVRYEEVLEQVSNRSFAAKRVAEPLFTNDGLPAESCADLIGLNRYSIAVHLLHYPLTVTWNPSPFLPGGLVDCYGGAWINNTLAPVTIDFWFEAPQGPGFEDYSCLNNGGNKQFFPHDQGLGFDLFQSFIFDSLTSAPDTLTRIPVFNIFWQRPFFPPCNGTIAVDDTRTPRFRALRIAPNPVSRRLRVLDDPIQPAEWWPGSTYTIFAAASGRVVAGGVLAGADIDVADLPGGSYLLLVNTGEVLYRARFVHE